MKYLLFLCLFPGLQDGAKQMDAGGYNAVAFSYGNKNESIEEKNNDSESGFCPSFQVPESLLQNLVSICPFLTVHLWLFLICLESCFFDLDQRGQMIIV